MTKPPDFAPTRRRTRCGWLTDRFGVSWQIIPRALGEVLADEDREKAGRVLQAMLQMSKIEIDGLRLAYEGAEPS